MACTGPAHHNLTNGVGKCSVPMWNMGGEAGFCDRPAYGPPSKCAEFYSYAHQRMVRWDGKYNGYVPGLACDHHAGPPPRHFGDPCVHCDTPHDDVAPGPCPRTAVAA